MAGAFTHPGHAYGKPDPAVIAAAAADERAALAAAGTALEGITDQAPVLSGGSTPTAEAGDTLPEHLDAGHVDFARQLAAKAWAYSVAVERRYRGLPPLPDVQVPYTLTAQAEALLEADPARPDLVPLPSGREVTA